MGATYRLQDLALLRAFIEKEVARGINSALLIGGEPTLFPDRVAEYVASMDNVTVSSNGLKPLPLAGFENLCVGVTLFGGGKFDDDLRAIKPNGSRFSGLFATALQNYRYDARACFIYALTEEGVDQIEETVRRIADNGNVVTFNYYSSYDTKDPLRVGKQHRPMEEALRVKALYPQTVLSTPHYIRTIITGETEWGSFGYDVCPSISVDYEGHADRVLNGNRVLPMFNAYAADLETVLSCCTSGHCEGCRDSQAVSSWLMVSLDRFMDSEANMHTWLELAEGYWAQFIWSPFHRMHRARAVTASAGERIAVSP
jgi:hypothetical protein